MTMFLCQIKTIESVDQHGSIIGMTQSFTLVDRCRRLAPLKGESVRKSGRCRWEEATQTWQTQLVVN